MIMTYILLLLSYYITLAPSKWIIYLLMTDYILLILPPTLAPSYEGTILLILFIYYITLAP